MIEHKGRIFGIVQGAILGVVVVTAFLYRRRQRMLENESGARLDTPDLRAFITRTTVPPATAGPRPAPPPPQQLESAFPSWTKQTPAHEILGVSQQAGPAEIEAAYRKLLKTYHPDRFASWGSGYQTRAHHVVLLIQEARDRLLGGRRR